tara:strand:- start:2132 stop:2668 length:537 start_codon:yes stop_codon:yes gene_type:complete
LNKIPDDLVPLGKIIKPHGIKGQVKFKPYNENSILLKKDMSVWLKNDKNNSLSFKFFKIISISYNSLQSIVKLDRVNDRNKAIELRNFILHVSRKSFPEIDKDNIYFVDLIGCEVYDTNERFIGIAKDVAHMPGGHDVIILELNSKEFMVPINDYLLKLFDIEKKYVMIDVIDGLVNT